MSKSRNRPPEVAPNWQATIRGRRYGDPVTANTKSEARSALKKQIGLPSAGRLPVGVEINRVK